MDNETSVKPLWGPWSPDLKSAAERTAQLRCLAGLVRVITKGNVSLVRALRCAEGATHHDDGSSYAFALEHARQLFDALPTLEARQIIATFASIHAPIGSKQMMAPDPPPRIPLTVSEVMAQYTGGLPPPPLITEGGSYCNLCGDWATSKETIRHRDGCPMLDPFPYE